MHQILYKMKEKKVYLTIIAILGLAIVFLIYFMMQQKQVATEAMAELEKTVSEKTDVTNELNGLLNQYEMLETDNDSLNARLGMESEKIKELLEELKTVKFSNKQQIEQYKKEAETLRNIMRSYIKQIDSLNTLNQNLVAENTEVKEKYQLLTNEKDLVTKQKDSLVGQVAEAASLRVGSLTVTALSKRDSETSRAERVKTIRTCVNVKENFMAQKGTRDIYVRLSLPDGTILLQSSEDLFNYGGEMIAYSATRQFDFTGDQSQVCVFYKHTGEELKPGVYKVDVFIEGNRLSSASFELK